MDMLQGKHFSITDPQNVNTVIYQINKTEGLMEENTPKFTLERLKCREELVGLNKRKTFFYNRKIQKRSRQKDYRKRFGTE